MLKTLLIAAVAAAATLAGVSSASAAEGCGPGFHRGAYGHCRPNRGPGPGPGPVVALPGVPAIGIFYPGRGYWDGHRYWMHRRGGHGGWRYY